jgi:hypothetical protein
MDNKEAKYKWRYDVERKKNQDLRREIARLRAELELTRRAHINATEAWIRAEDRLHENRTRNH